MDQDTEQSHPILKFAESSTTTLRAVSFSEEEPSMGKDVTWGGGAEQSKE